MSGPDAPRYNLVFAGQLLPGADPDRARRTLAAFFGLKDPAAVEVFFSGKAVPLRRNLAQEEARRLYGQLRSVGLICDLPVVREAPPPRRGEDSDATPATGEDTEAPPAEAPRPPPAGAAPNFFALRPALLERGIGEERDRHRVRAAIAGALAALLCLVVTTVTLRFPPAPVGAEPLGPIAATALDNGGLVVLLPDALLLHARSGLPGRRIGAAALGLQELLPPLHATVSGDLLLRGRDASGIRVLRCRIDAPACAPYLGDVDPGPAFAFAESYLGDTGFLYTRAGELLRVGAGGAIEARAEAPVPRARAALLYRDGLLLLPRADAPFLSVHRPDAQRFGAQLDALLLAPAETGASLPAGLLDVAAVGEDRYALVETQGGEPALYRFDAAWGSGEGVTLDAPLSARAYLVPWRDRLLVAEPTRAAMERIAPGGLGEAPFTSTMLEDAREDWQRRTRQRALLERGGIALPLTVAALALALAGLHLLSLGALARIPWVRTGLLDPMPSGIRWLPEAIERDRAVRRIAAALLAAAVLPALVAASIGPSPVALCFAPAILAALRARGLLGQGCGGYLGLRPQEVIAIDFDGRYFRGPPSALRQGRGFLLGASVALPLSAGGIRNIDIHEGDAIAGGDLGPAAAIGQLWLLGHPWLRAALTVALGWFLSLVAWVLVA